MVIPSAVGLTIFLILPPGEITRGVMLFDRGANGFRQACGFFFDVRPDILFVIHQRHGLVITIGEIYKEDYYRTYKDWFDHHPITFAAEKIFHFKTAVERQGFLDG